MAVGHLIPSTSACALRPEKIRASVQTQPDPIAPEPIRVDPSPIQLERDAVRRRLGSDPAWLETKSEKIPKLVILPSARLPRAFRVPSACLPARLRSDALSFGPAPLRLGSARFRSGSVLIRFGAVPLCSVLARLGSGL